jgi:hypothetical protein
MTQLDIFQSVTNGTISWEWVAGSTGVGLVGAIGLMFKRILKQLDSVIDTQTDMGQKETARSVAVETVRVTLERHDSDELRWREDFARNLSVWMGRMSDDRIEVVRRVEELEKAVPHRQKSR